MRDWCTGEPLTFRPIFKRSGGCAQVQAERGRPKNPRKTRVHINQRIFREELNQTAIMQALRFHFNLTCKHIARLILNQETKNAELQVSKLTTVTRKNEPEWWQRKDKAEAIDAAGKLLL